MSNIQHRDQQPIDDTSYATEKLFLLVTYIRAKAKKGEFAAADSAAPNVIDSWRFAQKIGDVNSMQGEFFLDLLGLIKYQEGLEESSSLNSWIANAAYAAKCEKIFFKAMVALENQLSSSLYSITNFLLDHAIQYEFKERTFWVNVLQYCLESAFQKEAKAFILRPNDSTDSFSTLMTRTLNHCISHGREYQSQLIKFQIMVLLATKYEELREDILEVLFNHIVMEPVEITENYLAAFLDLCFLVSIESTADDTIANISNKDMILRNLIDHFRGGKMILAYHYCRCLLHGSKSDQPENWVLFLSDIASSKKPSSKKGQTLKDSEKHTHQFVTTFFKKFDETEQSKVILPNAIIAEFVTDVARSGRYLVERNTAGKVIVKLSPKRERVIRFLVERVEVRIRTFIVDNLIQSLRDLGKEGGIELNQRFLTEEILRETLFNQPDSKS